MASLANVGFFKAEQHPMLKEPTTFRAFLNHILSKDGTDQESSVKTLEDGEEIIDRLILLGHCLEKRSAINCVKTIK